MPPLLSPAETLGLAGAALDGRVRRAATHVSNAAFARLNQRLKADALSNRMIYEHEGVIEPVRVMLRPLLAMREQLGYVHQVCLRLTEALKRFPSLYLADEKFRRILAISEAEESWLRAVWNKDHQRLNPVYGRLDAVCDFAGAGWQESLHFMEPNLSGVGGIHFAPLAEQLVMRDIVPTLLAHDSGLSMELLRDQRELFLQVLMDHARALGRETCVLAFIDPKYVHDGPDEQTVLSEYLARTFGVTVVHADPRELRVEGEEVFFEDVRIDVAYRDYECRELVELEAEIGKPLDAMRLLFKQNRVVSSMVGDFDHKSCFEILTDPALAESLFTPEDCRLFRRHVLWTRLVAERRTVLPMGVEGELLPYAREHRELLVLKPNRAYGGTGVTLGASVAAEDWERLLDEAVSLSADPEKSYVLQTATRLPVYQFPVLSEDGRVFGEPFYTVMGFAATENGLGILCRVSQKQVVNVAQHGGLAAVLVTDQPPDLRVPLRSANRAAGLKESLRNDIVELRRLDHMIALLGWDEETMLPDAARSERGEQTASLEAARHALLISDRLGDLIEDVAEEYGGDSSLARELYLLRRLRRAALALPEDLIRRLASAKSRSFGAWDEARNRSDFAVFAGPFAEVLKLSRERANALKLGPELYDALLDENEPGMTRARLDPVLEEVKAGLVPLVRAAADASPSRFAGRMFEEPAQWALCRDVLAAIGFDFARGRLDASAHPFTMIAGENDVRITLNIDESDVTSAVLTALHEGGHGLYDQGFARQDRHSLLGEAPGMGMHECQARLWENHVGRSRAFWTYLLPKLRELFGTAMDGLDARALYDHVNRVRPGTIRVAADEMSYHLHIILRYELEVALLSGDLRSGDLPQAWNERSAALLGARPKSDREGVLQDVHWAMGLFGYFPSYTLGSLYGAQLMETYERNHRLDGEIVTGGFAQLKSWLRETVHELGHRFSAEEIVEKATGKGLDSAAFFRYLERKAKH